MRTGKALKILVADDNEVNLKVMLGMLEYAGHQVESVRDGREVLAVLDSESFDLLVLDCLMPGMDGFEVARRIRAKDSLVTNPQIPILAVTALASEQDRRRCLGAGMNGFCSKPVQSKALFAWIAEQFDLPGDSNNPVSNRVDQNFKVSAQGTSRETSEEKQLELVRKMSAVLIRDATDWQPLLLELLAAGNHRGLGVLAHKIRGTADVMGFRELSEIAMKLEESGKKGIASESSAQVPQLIAALQQILDDVRELS